MGTYVQGYPPEANLIEQELKLKAPQIDQEKFKFFGSNFYRNRTKDYPKEYEAGIADEIMIGHAELVENLKALTHKENPNEIDFTRFNELFATLQELNKVAENSGPEAWKKIDSILSFYLHRRIMEYHPDANSEALIERRAKMDFARAKEYKDNRSLDQIKRDLGDFYTRERISVEGPYREKEEGTRGNLARHVYELSTSNDPNFKPTVPVEGEEYRFTSVNQAKLLEELRKIDNNLFSTYEV